jgi:hypothetical protein
MPLQGGVGSADDPLQVQQRFFIDLVAAEQFGVVAEVREETN